MARNITMEIDGAVITMISSASNERIEAVQKIIGDTISHVKRKGASINTSMIYRYTMVYLADKIFELKDVLENTDKAGTSNQESSLEDKKEIQRLKDEIAEWENRVSQLQELLLEKNQKLMEYKATR